MKSLLLAGTLACLAGCGASEPVEIGPDTYVVSVENDVWFVSASGLIADGYKKAAEFCHTMGKYPMTMEASGHDSGGALVKFRCLTAGDVDLHRPYYRPSVIVEQQNPQHNNEPRE